MPLAVLVDHRHGDHLPVLAMLALQAELAILDLYAVLTMLALQALLLMLVFKALVSILPLCCYKM